MVADRKSQSNQKDFFKFPLTFPGSLLLCLDMNALTEKIQGLNGAQFASLTYRAKGDSSLARYTIILGAKYIPLLERSILELELLETTTELEAEAKVDVMLSLQKSLDAHRQGEQSEDYTKKGMYESLGNGVNVNTNDGTIQLFGLVQSKVVLEPGTPKKHVKSAPLTLAKNQIRSQLPISKFREFAIDAGCLETAKVQGDTFVVIAG